MKKLTLPFFKITKWFIGPINKKRLIFIFCILGAMLIPSVYAFLLLLVFPYFWSRAQSKEEITQIITDYSFATFLPAFFLLIEGLNNFDLSLNIFVIFFLYQILTATIFYWMSDLSWKRCGRFHGFFLGMAFIIKLVPFMGITDWVSPLQVSGILYPGFGVFGIVCFLAFISLMNSRKAIAGFIALSIAANSVFYFTKKSLPLMWEALQTSVSDKNEYKLLLPQVISKSPSSYIVNHRGSKPGK